MKNKNDGVKSLAGVLIGAINSLFGAGGGLVTVPYLLKTGLSQQQAQATSTAVILPLCVLSSLLFMRHTPFDFKRYIVLIIPGMVGAVIGGLALKKIPSKLLKGIFSLFMIYAGIRMLIE